MRLLTVSLSLNKCKRSKNITLNVEMETTTIREEIVVRESPATIDMRQTALGVNVSHEMIQALPGAASPLFRGRYAMLTDGQWRVAEIAELQAAARRDHRPVPSYGVVPLPPPPGGPKNAGWVNGNFFIVPRGGKNPQGFYPLPLVILYRGHDC